VTSPAKEPIGLSPRSGHARRIGVRSRLAKADQLSIALRQYLRIAEIGFGGRDILREVIKFFRNAAQFSFQVLLGRLVRQSPGVIGLRVIVG
jgi:hypothetical protein